jgi:hypothetical protein
MGRNPQSQRGLTEELVEWAINHLFDGLEVRIGATVLAPERERTVAARFTRFVGRNRVAGLLIIAFGVDVFACLKWAPSLLPFLLGGALVWMLTARRDGFLSKAAADLSAIMVLGLTAVSLGLIALNLSPGYADPERVHGAEQWLSDARLTIKDAFSWPLEVWLAVGTALVALAVVATKLNAVEKLKRAHAGVGFVQTLLLMLTSFVIYAQPPLQRELDRTHHRIATEYRAALDREWNADATRAAALTVTHNLQAPTVQRQLMRTVSMIAAQVNANHDEVVAIELDAFNHAPAPLVEEVTTLEEQKVIDPVPRSPRQLDRQLKAVEERQSIADKSGSAAAQAMRVLALVAPQIASIPVPSGLVDILPGQSLVEFVQTALEGATENLAEAFSSRIVGAFRSKETAQPDRKLDTVKLTDAELPTEPPQAFMVTYASISPAVIDPIVARVRSEPAGVQPRTFDRGDHALVDLVDADWRTAVEEAGK